MGRPCHRKIKFEDQAAAFRFSMKVRRNGKNRQDIYPCRICGFFHLTHAKGTRKPRKE